MGLGRKEKIFCIYPRKKKKKKKKKKTIFLHQSSKNTREKRARGNKSPFTRAHAK